MPDKIPLTFTPEALPALVILLALSHFDSINLDVRAGGAGGLQPPKSWATQIFWVEREIWAKPVCFEEINIFSIYPEVGVLKPVKFTSRTVVA